jgi:hypothetical protein
MPELGERVVSSTARFPAITHSPARCLNGHSLGPREVLVGHHACLGHGGGHTTWTCTFLEDLRAPLGSNCWLTQLGGRLARDRNCLCCSLISANRLRTLSRSCSSWRCCTMVLSSSPVLPW